MTLVEKYNDLLLHRMKLDKFFSMFLEKFERQMDPDNTDTPVWKLYKTKLREYEKVQHEIISTKYWIDKERNVQYG